MSAARCGGRGDGIPCAQHLAARVGAREDQGKIKGRSREDQGILLRFEPVPNQDGNFLNAGGINYAMLRQQDALKRLNELERLTPR
jgi:hypothetical protein